MDPAGKDKRPLRVRVKPKAQDLELRQRDSGDDANDHEDDRPPLATFERVLVQAGFALDRIRKIFLLIFDPAAPHDFTLRALQGERQSCRPQRRTAQRQPDPTEIAALLA